MILVIDNYDSFVHNLARHIEILGYHCVIKRNDAITLDEVSDLNPRAIIISPGPCTPYEAGISMEVIRAFGPTIPILGVCLGHQAIGEVYHPHTTQKSDKPVHGKASFIEHDGQGLFHSLPHPMSVGRYHSLIVDLPQKQSSLIVNAYTRDSQEIMAFSHKTYPVYGIQFHPESILTPDGLELLKNFFRLCDDWHIQNEAC